MQNSKEYLTLNLTCITESKTGKKSYYAVNDRHYDGMLAGAGTSLDDEYPWVWLGDVMISEEILNEQGYFFKE